MHGGDNFRAQFTRELIEICYTVYSTHVRRPISRYTAIGSLLRAPGSPDRSNLVRETDGRQASEIALAAGALNRMLDLGRPEHVRIA